MIEAVLRTSLNLEAEFLLLISKVTGRSPEQSHADGARDSCDLPRTGFCRTKTKTTINCEQLLFSHAVPQTVQIPCFDDCQG